jgi:hypothetical protein
MEPIGAANWPEVALPKGILDRLANNPLCGYLRDSPPTTEPTALAAMALIAHARFSAAREALHWLAENQSEDGSLGIDSDTPRPRWPTGWALLAWQSAQRSTEIPVPHDANTRFSQSDLSRWADASKRAAKWIRWLYGRRTKESDFLEHNTQLRGWPWVDGTHSWVEPTAINVLALKAASHAKGHRVREAVEMLLDRMLPDGGWNYGNTIVMGNTLRPHVQPTGLALAALHGQPAAGTHVQTSLKYLRGALSQRTTAASLCYALLGAAAHGIWFEGPDKWIVATANRTLEADQSPYKLALLELAVLGPRCPWFT